MCKFGACILSKSELSKKCAYKKNFTEFEVPWSSNQYIIDYTPSNRLCPKNGGIPVMVDGKHFQRSEGRLFCPMYWTLVPSTFLMQNKEKLDCWTSTTYNARVENLNESKIYSKALSDGNRCVVVLEGFYEGAYYLQPADNSLVKAAGIFTNLKFLNGQKSQSCTIITTESDNNLSKIHNRMPLVLRSDEDVQAWLDYKTISPSDAVSKIRENPEMNFKIIRASEKDNEKKFMASKNFMSNWLNSGGDQCKKRKRED